MGGSHFKTAAFVHSATPPDGRYRIGFAIAGRAAVAGEPEDQAKNVSVSQVAMPATAAVRIVPHAMSTTVTTVGQPRRVAWLVRSYVA